jgi:hypothetical protein
MENITGFEDYTEEGTVVEVVETWMYDNPNLYPCHIRVTYKKDNREEVQCFTDHTKKCTAMIGMLEEWENDSWPEVVHIEINYKKHFTGPMTISAKEYQPAAF